MARTMDLLGSGWSAKERLRGSGVEPDYDRNPRRVWFHEGASEKQKRYAALGRDEISELLHERGDGSWVIQDKPDATATTPAIQRLQDANWIARVEPLPTPEEQEELDAEERELEEARKREQRQNEEARKAREALRAAAPEPDPEPEPRSRPALDPDRNPERVWFKDGVTEEQKHHAALGRVRTREIVEKHGDGSWTVQNRPPGSPTTALYVSPEQRAADASWIARREPLYDPEPVEQPARAPSTGQAAEPVNLLVRVRDGQIERGAVWDAPAGRWRGLPLEAPARASNAGESVDLMLRVGAGRIESAAVWDRQERRWLQLPLNAAEGSGHEVADLMGSGWAQKQRPRRPRGSGQEAYAEDGDGLAAALDTARELSAAWGRYIERTNGLVFRGENFDHHTLLLRDAVRMYGVLAEQHFAHLDRWTAALPRIEERAAGMREFLDGRRRLVEDGPAELRAAEERAAGAELSGDTARAEYLQAQAENLRERIEAARGEAETAERGYRAYLELALAAEDATREMSGRGVSAADANDHMFSRAELAVERFRTAANAQAADRFRGLLDESLDVNSRTLDVLKDAAAEGPLDRLRNLFGSAVRGAAGGFGMVAGLAVVAALLWAMARKRRR